MGRAGDGRDDTTALTILSVAVAAATGDGFSAPSAFGQFLAAAAGGPGRHAGRLRCPSGDPLTANAWRSAQRDELLRWRDAGRPPDEGLRVLERELDHKERLLPDRRAAAIVGEGGGAEPRAGRRSAPFRVPIRRGARLHPSTPR
ncbi:hypothetical protein GCM10009557_22870 [Virgisporangium ochraceum]|uniref:Uncharacterized protein n=1 Tax=Virgisporangium ochraceum TaxID=65505 RepID=A0A8J4EGT8_9ACTN|nr:hypothetical protein Voc01_100620 [Virgisporangium ochraceum]